MSISPYTLTDGTKRYRVRLTLPDGTRTDRRGFRTKAEARKWEAEYLAGLRPADTGQPLRNYVDDLRARINRKSPGTISVYMTALDTHIIPKWGSWGANTVTRQEVQRWIDQENFGRSVCDRNLSLLRMLIDCAGVEPKDNPVRDLDKPRRGRQQNTYLTFQQLVNLAAATNDTSKETLVLLLGTTGARWGEAAGLRVQDWDRRNLKLHIWQTASMVRNELVIGPPKNGHDRWVSVPEFLAPRLDREAGARRPDSPLFLGPRGSYMRRPKGRSWFDGAKKRAHGKDDTFPLDLRIHDLRHTAASLQVAGGANIKVVQRQLGHATASMTLDIYADLFAEDLSSATSALNEMYQRGQNVGTAEESDG